MHMDTSSSFIPRGFLDLTDVAECALDEQLELLQRQYAAACRAVERSRCEVEQLEQRDDIEESVLGQARRRRAAAETRSQQIMSAIDALEDRRTIQPGAG